MTELKLKTKTFHTVNYFDLEEFIQDQFMLPEYSFVADQESSNDSSHTFSVSDDQSFKPDSYEYGRVKDFLLGKYVSFITGDLLQYLFQQGQIPEGEYLVEVCW